MSEPSPLGRGVFVSDARFLPARGGGVQICTHEYIRTLRAAGVALDIVGLPRKPSIAQRLRHRLLPNPYLLQLSRAELDQLAAAGRDADFVFLNQVNLITNGAAIRDAIGSRPRLILLSHGCEVTDLLLGMRGRREGLPVTIPGGLSASWTLGSVLETEMHSRAFVDGVITLSHFDQEMEDWYGVERVTWVPRVITPTALDLQPVPKRFGYVGTLNHAPNLEGLVKVLEAADAADAGLTIDVIGGPPSIGEWLQKRFASANYLGALDDAQLEARAATWSAFLHPIFHIARGCSTKLAQPIGWGMPIVTTPQGRRGYRWTDGSLIERDTPAAFVAAMIALDPAALETAQREVEKLRASSPTTEQVALEIRAFLNGFGA